MKKGLLTIGILVVAIPLIAAADEIQYAVFAPDMSKSVTVVRVATPFQFFTPYDDYVSGFDIWIDNPGAAGNASFGLRDENDTLLEAKTVTIPSISGTWGGQKFHVAFDNPVHVSSTKPYKIKVLSSLPDLRMYYGDLAALQQHTSDYTVEKNVLPAYLGTVEQAFAFKFALYEDQESAAPIISQVTETLDAPTSVTIAFNINEPADYGVLLAKAGDAYPPGPSFTGSYTHCQGGVKQCEVSVATEPDTSYIYRLTAQDSWGNQSMYEGLFVTNEEWFEEKDDETTTEPDEEELTISNVQIVTLTATLIEVAWSTNDPANASMLLEIIDQNGIRPVASFGDSTYELEHFLSSGNILKPEKQYIVSLLSFDVNGEMASYEFQVATPAESTPPPPPDDDEDGDDEDDTSTSTATNTDESGNEEEGSDDEEEVTVQVVTSTGGSSATFTYGSGGTTPSGGYRVDIFSTDGNAPVRVSSVTSATNMARINELDPGSYYAIVYKNEGGVFKKVGPPVEVTIKQPTSTSAWDTYRLPVILGGAAVLAALIGTAVILRKTRKHYYRP